MRNGMGADSTSAIVNPPKGPLVERVGVPLMWLGIGFGVGYIACLMVTKPKRQAV